MSKIVGYRYAEWVSKEDKKQHVGYEIYVEDDWPEYKAKDSCGVMAKKVWCPDVDLFIDSGVKLGDKVEFLYNERKRLVRILPL